MLPSAAVSAERTFGRSSKYAFRCGACSSIKSFSGMKAPCGPYWLTTSLIRDVPTISGILPDAKSRFMASPEFFVLEPIVAFFKHTLVISQAATSTGQLSS